MPTSRREIGGLTNLAMPARGHVLISEAASEQRTLLVKDAFRITRDMDDAEDVVHDVLTTVVVGRKELSKTSMGYLRRAVRNRALNRVRDAARQRRIRTLVSASEQLPLVRDDWYLAVDRVMAARQLLEMLPPHCARVARMHWLEGYTCAAVATELGCSQKSIEKHVARALKTMRAVLLHGVQEWSEP